MVGVRKGDEKERRPLPDRLVPSSTHPPHPPTAKNQARSSQITLHSRRLNSTGLSSCSNTMGGRFDVPK